MFEDRCVCCGEIIPEGRIICPMCELKNENKMLERGLRSKHAVYDDAMNDMSEDYTEDNTK